MSELSNHECMYLLYVRRWIRDKSSFVSNHCYYKAFIMIVHVHACKMDAEEVSVHSIKSILYTLDSMHVQYHMVGYILYVYKHTCMHIIYDICILM